MATALGAGTGRATLGDAVDKTASVALLVGMGVRWRCVAAADSLAGLAHKVIRRRVPATLAARDFAAVAVASVALPP